MKKYKSFKRAFTLVELIIVIAIIAILAVTAFLLLTKWLSKARDSSRASNLANIEKSLQISLTDKSSLPKPDSYTLIYASGTSNVVGYQGDFGEGAKDAVGNINSAPKDGDDYFLYYLSNDLTKYQLASFVENETAYNPNTVNAVDYSSRYINVKGNQLGMLFDATNKSPVNKLGMTGVDIMNYTGASLQMVFTKNKTLQGTGQTLRGGFVGEGLVGYYPFDETAGTIAYDKSPFANNGILSGVTLPTWTGGKVNNALRFTTPLTTNVKSGGVVLINKYNGTQNILDTPMFTFTFWLKSDIDTGNLVSQPIVSMNTTKSYSFSRIHPAISAKNSVQIYSKNLGKRITIRTKTDLIKDTWYFISGNYDGHYLKLYINGTLNNQILINSSLVLGDGYLYIGQGSSTECFRGLIDEVRIYNRALSDNEVMMLYNISK